MPSITFQILEGIDKGRVFRELPTPVTIGREEGNVLRLNDERVSRFHAKIQSDDGEIIITDLDSTNGTRVNGNVVQIRRLKAGDRVHVGRSILLFGSDAEIRARAETMAGTNAHQTMQRHGPATVPGPTMLASLVDDLDIELNPTEKLTTEGGTIYSGTRALPPLPQKMTPAQAARLAEMLDFLHKQLTVATDNVRCVEEVAEVKLSYHDWQRVTAVQMLLARYVRAVAEPDALEG